MWQWASAKASMRAGLGLHSASVSEKDEPAPELGEREACFLVFSQARDARVDVAAWNAHARRFFDVGLTEALDGGLVVTPKDEDAGVRFARGRPRDPSDLALAEAADEPPTGLALL